jgi:hypothetical protein
MIQCNSNFVQVSNNDLQKYFQILTIYFKLLLRMNERKQKYNRNKLYCVSRNERLDYSATGGLLLVGLLNVYSKECVI